MHQQNYILAQCFGIDVMLLSLITWKRGNHNWRVLTNIIEQVGKSQIAMNNTWRFKVRIGVTI